MAFIGEFETLLRSRDLISVGNIAELAPSVAIDGEVWLEDYLPSEPLIKVIGGPPSTLNRALREKIKPLVDAGIKPIIVFNGISPNVFDNKNLQTKATRRAECWKHLDTNLNDFRASLSTGKKITEEIFGEVVKAIRTLGGDVIRAPYISGPQLAYLESHYLVKAIMGKPDLLLYNPQKIVLKINYDEQTYEYIKTDDVLAALDIDLDELMNVFIYKGYMFGKVLDPQPVTTLISTFKGKTVLQHKNMKDAEYYQKTKLLLQSRVVLRCQEADISVTPDSKLKTILGERFPKELYFAFCIIPLSSQVFSTLSSGSLIELPPYADSNYYREALNKVKSLRSKTNAVLLKSLSPSHANLFDVDIVYWYNTDREKLPKVNISQFKWVFTDDEISDELERQNSKNVDLVFCLKWHSHSYMKKAGIYEHMLTEEEESAGWTSRSLMTRVLFRFLEHMNYFGKDGMPMLFGVTLMRCAPKWQYNLLLIQELFQYGLLNGRTLAQTKTGFLSDELFNKLCIMNVRDEERHSISLVSRVFSLVAPTLSEEEWSGAVDYPLSQFFSIVKVLVRSLRSLLEVILLSEFLNGRVGWNKNMLNLIDSLPYGSHNNIALGIAIKLLLLGKTLGEVKPMLPQCINLEQDLASAWEFWKELIKTVKYFYIHFKAIQQPMYDDFMYATKILRETLIRNHIKI